MTDTIHVLARRALQVAAVVVVIGAVACGESPTAPGIAKHPATQAVAKKKGGYNVVAD